MCLGSQAEFFKEVKKVSGHQYWFFCSLVSQVVRNPSRKLPLPGDLPHLPYHDMYDSAIFLPVGFYFVLFQLSDHSDKESKTLQLGQAKI